MEKLVINAEVMHNWPHHKNDFMCKQLPLHIQKAMDLQHKEHSRGLNVRESAAKICTRFPDYLEFGFAPFA